MSNKALSRAIWAIIIIVILVVAIAAGVYFYTTTKPTKAISITATTLETTQGMSITFTLLNLASNGKATIYFGDGQSATGLTSSSASASHTYADPGTYLVTAQETVGGSVVSSTNSAMKTILITPSVSASNAPLISVPVISLNATLNPSEPVVSADAAVYLSGGYLEAPTGTNIVISEYIWDFANGANQTVTANSNTMDPNVNPVNTTYAQTGLYPVSLTLVTENTATSQTYSTTVEHTVAVGSSAQPYAVYVYAGKVASPGVINVAEMVAAGPYSFDPQIDYESVGYEVILNTFATLLVYDGSSTTTFLPMLASAIPSTSNGGVNSADTVYTFTIRSGMKFSNGDPITAYDVYYSTIRNMLFEGGTPGTPDWILSQYLVPGASIGVSLMKNSTDTGDFNAITHAVGYSSSANTVTFNLITPTTPQIFFTALADSLGSGVSDASWLGTVGASITFTPAGFYSYQSQANEGSYNTQVQFSPVTSGPYEIESYVPGQSIVLAPNPGFPGVPGIPAMTDKVSISWVKDAETAYLLYTSGSADIVTALPTTYMPLIKDQVAAGTSSLYSFPTLACAFYVFNENVAESLMHSTFGSSYSVPANYFANPLVREAFTYAFNYTNYIDEILGNDVYGENFGSAYAGAIINGLPYYVPSSQLANVPSFNLTYATQLMQQSGQYSTKVNIPFVVGSGDTVNYAAAEMLAAALSKMDPNISMTPIYEPFSTEVGDTVPGANPMPIYSLAWISDYPAAADNMNALYLQGGTYPSGNGLTVSYLNSTGYPTEAAQYAQLNTVLTQANAATNPTVAGPLYKQAEQDAINLYLYIYTVDENAFWTVKPYMTGYNGIQSQENPLIGGALDSTYYWWVKG
ncbi:MAG TPA: ABC transporter substrate-binding protein [Candidatus Limnocylindrales bacterium]|nr:ABC transporter substrate-binding protein [Candidatus Limnocylindrales bacterium]